jgi:hypothetical protein
MNEKSKTVQRAGRFTTRSLSQSGSGVNVLLPFRFKVAFSQPQEAGIDSRGPQKQKMPRGIEDFWCSNSETARAERRGERGGKSVSPERSLSSRNDLF